ncbi:MAG: hypothetical protein PHD15_04065 [Clostridia bacterium]|nr:hypothetical protein [Clostridia bacterium]MDD4386915.1 hypothetical protein [Clostridia bacterium]
MNNVNCLLSKRGISLIVLIITIIIIIILAGAVILSLAQNNPIKKAEEANFKNNISNYQGELSLWITKEYLLTQGTLDVSTVNATKDTGTYMKDGNTLKIKDIITSIKLEDEDIFEIKEGNLFYTGTDDDEINWIGDTGISIGDSGDEVVALAVDIVAGNGFTTVLLDDGVVKAWGNNSNGQLGDGTINDRYIPTIVPGLTNVKKLEAGGYHALALLNDETVKAWGSNWSGQIGIGTWQDVHVPIIVPGFTNIKELTGGSDCSLALLNDGTVKASGGNWAGQLGDGTGEDAYSPVIVPGLTNIKQLSSGSNFSIALLNDGTVKAFGGNWAGQLGDGTGEDSYSPVIVPGLTNVNQVATGFEHVFALLNDGTVKAWGANSYGQLGDGSEEDAYTPVIVPGLTNVKQLAGGSEFSVALLNDGTVKTWGNNSDGQLGDGTTEAKLIPTTVPGLTNVKQLAVGENHVVVILNDGTIKTWGNNGNGQLGDGTTDSKYIPTQIDVAYVDTVGPKVEFGINGGIIPTEARTTVTVSDVSGVDPSTLQYVWDTQNITTPSSGWAAFTNGQLFTKTDEGTYYLWIKSGDNLGNNSVNKSKAFIVSHVINVNKPVLSAGMTAKEWNGSTWETVSSPDTDTSWYNYATNKWANAQTADGSMWVWIPRYVYRISSLWHESAATGDIVNIQFSQGTNDEWNSTHIGILNNDTGATASNRTWTKHPAFTFGDKELTGIWVAKFEASNNSEKVKVVPNVVSWRNITVNNIFNACRAMEIDNTYGWGTSGTGIDTHMLKNVEWGAIVYLTQSVYGRNGVEIWRNPDTNYTTGRAGTNKFAMGTTSTYSYDNLTYGVNTSTTGNIYGIYDMSGCAFEYTAAYINNGHSTLTTYGNSLVSASAQYKDVYLVETDVYSDNYPNTVYKKGDAVYETANSGGGVAWFNDFVYMLDTSESFFLRSNNYDSYSSRLFGFIGRGGYADVSFGFRPALIVSDTL